MKYLCLIYFEEQKLDALSRSEYDALVGEALADDEMLRKSGHFIVAQALQSVQAATTLRPQSGKLSITDGAFAETKAQLGGFILIGAKDLDEAIQVASKIPPARLGCIEVQPLKELTPMSKEEKKSGLDRRSFLKTVAASAALVAPANAAIEVG